jgi:bacteriocin biosynthesis cyclodehydratase domain-containing protein
MNKQETSSRAIHIFTVGKFGQAVAARLEAQRPEVVETAVKNDTIPIPGMWPDSCVTVIAGWRPSPNLCEMLEEFSYQRQRPFVPLFQVSGALRLGPVVVPGKGPCWTCSLRRFKQHAEWPEAEAALLDHYARLPESGPHGFLEPFAVMAAARLSHTIQQLLDQEPIGGQIWQIHMLTRDIIKSQAIGIHGCPRCGLDRAAPARTFIRMHEQLSYLWAAAAGEGD